eukprot:TRINITY_DN6898_c0_g1_i1.p1 TRINITY_DN6898_c0_g1~~TRINITY_DN6898_c0_g1_i1.p1  ORF type:complete len:454 (+),score=74.45 TRINITY_DN6898_c0_g1_i1:1445-2806(+)
MSSAELSELFAQVDEDKSGNIDDREFIILLYCWVYQKKVNLRDKRDDIDWKLLHDGFRLAEKCFKHAGPDKTMSIRFEQLNAFLQTLYRDKPREDLLSLLNRLKIEKNSPINFPTFLFVLRELELPQMVPVEILDMTEPTNCGTRSTFQISDCISLEDLVEQFKKTIEKPESLRVQLTSSKDEVRRQILNTSDLHNTFESFKRKRDVNYNKITFLLCKEAISDKTLAAICTAAKQEELKSTSIDLTKLEWSKKIGKGGFGEVWRGNYDGKVVAIKKLIISEDLSAKKAIEQIPEDSKEAYKYFLEEVELMEQLRGLPNVVEYMGASTKPPNVCCILEYMERGSLREVINNQKIPWRLVLKIVSDCTNGLSSLHNHQPPIVHRDVKSHNFLVAEDYTTKISDFGTSKVMNSLTATNSRMGTFNWTAPEIFEGEPFTEKSDIFSLGLVFLGDHYK